MTYATNLCLPISSRNSSSQCQPVSAQKEAPWHVHGASFRAGDGVVSEGCQQPCPVPAHLFYRWRPCDRPTSLQQNNVNILSILKTTRQ